MSNTQNTAPLTIGQQKMLMQPLNDARISHRKQGGANLSYLESWDVKASLIRIFGFGGFSADVIQTEVLYKESIEKKGNNGPYNQWKVSVQSTVRLHIKQLDVTYTESAVGDGSMGDISEALDKALKTASSDALKRCAIYLGTQFGLSLYNNGDKSDVVRMVAAPDQRWYQGAPLDQDRIQAEQVFKDQQRAIAEEMAKEAAKAIEAPDVPDNAPQAVSEAPAAPQQGAQPVLPTSQDIPQDGQCYPNVTDEQHEANKNLLARALDAQEVQQSNTQRQS